MNSLKQGFIDKMVSIKQATELWHLLVAVIVALVGAWAWTTTFFQTATAAEISHKEIISQMTAVHEQLAHTQEEQNAQISDLKSLLELKIKQDNLNQVLNDIRNNDTETFQIQQWVKVNGEDAQSAKRLRDLKNEREELIVKRDCVINGNRACD